MRSGGQVEGGREVIALDSERSQFTYDINLSLNGPAKLVGPILRRNLKKDLERFRMLIETDAVAAPA
ncbi:MAG: hypothetical protein ACKVHU_00525 [Acidimicrobiales bacterium]